MRRNSWLQKILYIMIALLASYILFKSGELAALRPSADQEPGEGSVQQSLEDAAMRTWAPGYTGAIEGKKGESWPAAWMKQVVPVYSFLAGEESGAETEGQTDESDGQAETQPLTEAQSGTERETQPLTEVEPATEPETQPLTETQSATEPETQPLTETQSATEPETQPLTETQPETEPGTQSLTEAEALETEESESQAQTGQETAVEASAESLAVKNIWEDALGNITGLDDLLANYYIVDEDTSVDAAVLNASDLLTRDLSLKKDPKLPQILIYHTHSQETFVDSREGETADSIVGMGEVLAGELRARGYQVIHDTGVYDLVDGVLDRSAAYDYARAAVEEILDQNPGIEVVIDLHRDGVEGEKFVTEIDGRPTSMIMFFNGLSRDENGTAISYLPNENLEDNLAFSLQLETLAQKEFPGFTRKIYLKAERFNLHLRPRSLLVEAGTQLNTVEEERNAMGPLAELISQVLG